MAEDLEVTGAKNEDTGEASENVQPEEIPTTETGEVRDPIEPVEGATAETGEIEEKAVEPVEFLTDETGEADGSPEPVEVITAETVESDEKVAPAEVVTAETVEVPTPEATRVEPVETPAETVTVEPVEVPTPEATRAEPVETPAAATEKVEPVKVPAPKTEPVEVPAPKVPKAEPVATPTAAAEKVEPVEVPAPKVATTKTPTPEGPREPNFLVKPIIAFRRSMSGVLGKFTPPLLAYTRQWPRTFLVWFLFLLCLSVLVWRFLPGDATVGNYTPAQGLFIPITIFGGPLILAVFIATHGGLEWYSNTVAVKGIGLRLIDFFFKITSVIGNLLPFNRNRREEVLTPHSGIADLPFPGIGFQGFIDRYIPPETATAEQVLEKVSRYQLQNLGKIAVNFFIVYVLVKLPAIILWETLSLTLEWSVYRVGFSLARVPFPALTIYHWELFLIENIAVAFVIFFQEVRLDTSKVDHIDDVLPITEVGQTEASGS